MHAGISAFTFHPDAHETDSRQGGGVIPERVESFPSFIYLLFLCFHLDFCRMVRFTYSVVELNVAWKHLEQKEITDYVFVNGCEFTFLLKPHRYID